MKTSSNDKNVSTVQMDPKDILYKSGAVLLLILSVFVVLKSVHTVMEYRYIGQDIEPQAMIKVSGEGEVQALPDTATFRVSVIEQAKTAQAAQQAAAKLADNAIERVREFGVADENIKTLQYQQSPQYEYLESRSDFPRPPERERAITGYEVRQTIEVKLTDRDQAGEIITALSELGVQQISNVRMTIDDEDKLKNEARAKAITDARGKAEILAADLGVDLARIINFDEDRGYRPMYAERAMASDGGGDEAKPAPLPAGEQTVSSNVNITYEIR